MKIAFATSGQDLAAPLDERFGRAAAFLVYDLDQDTFTVVGNRLAHDAAQGAGVQAAEQVARSGASALVAGHCGPKAMRVLRAAGVSVYTAPAISIADALARYRAGALTEVRDADVEGHWA